MAFDLEASKEEDNESNSYDDEVLSQDPFVLIKKESQINDEEEEYVRK